MAATTTLAQGSSVTLTVGATDSLLIDGARSASAIVEAVTGVPGAANRQIIAKHPGGQAVYGPFGAGTVKLSAVGGAIAYSQGSAPISDEPQDVKYNQTSQSLVSGDGTQWLIPGAATFTASDAGTDWYRVPDVLQIAAVLDSGTSTTVLVEVRTAAGVVSTALTITADTVAQVLRNSILTMEMHEFRIRRSSGTGTVTITI